MILHDNITFRMTCLMRLNNTMLSNIKDKFGRFDVYGDDIQFND